METATGSWSLRRWCTNSRPKQCFAYPKPESWCTMPLHLPEDRLQFSAYKGHQARRSQVWFPSGAFAFVRFPCLCRTKTWALVYRTTLKVSQVWVVNPTLAQRHLSLGEGGVDKVAEDCWHRLQQHCRRSSGEKSMKEMLVWLHIYIVYKKLFNIRNKAKLYTLDL